MAIADSASYTSGGIAIRMSYCGRSTGPARRCSWIGRAIPSRSTIAKRANRLQLRSLSRYWAQALTRSQERPRVKDWRIGSGDSGEVERSFRKEAERHSGMIPNTIGAQRRWQLDCARKCSASSRETCPERSEDGMVVARDGGVGQGAAVPCPASAHRDQPGRLRLGLCDP